mmetsp:Transcript_35042/g.110246  ORF Transcript_35042/g.110246 Transcript_35042/m.110246 type:complete len:305 (-) Transcript_35042:419-1333(-)
MHVQGDQALRRGAAGHGDVCVLDAARLAPRRGHVHGHGADLGLCQVQEAAHLLGAHGARGHHGLERAPAGHRQPRQACVRARRARARRRGLPPLRAQAGDLRPQMELRRQQARERRQRQQAPGVVAGEGRQRAAAPVLGAHGGGQGDRLVAAPARPARERRRHGGSLHPVLEHAHGRAAELHGHGFAGLQPHVEPQLQRDRVHARLLAEPDHPLEVPKHDQGGDAHGALLPRALLEHVAGRADYRYRRRRRDAALLERLPRVQKQRRRAHGAVAAVPRGARHSVVPWDGAFGGWGWGEILDGAN